MMRHHAQVSQTTIEPAGSVAVGRDRLTAERLQLAFDVVADQVAGGALPSAVLAVADAEGTIRIEAFSGGDTTAPDAIYLLASITKPMVATAVMQLVERGLLVLSSPVQRVIPEFQPAAATPDQQGASVVTAHHLLTHTSGLVDIDAELLSRERPDRRRLLEIACTFPLRFAPGARFEYNSLSFVLLGELIRRLDGRDYPDALAADLFAPLAMTSMGFKPADRQRAVRSVMPGFPPELQPMVAGFFDSMQAPGGGLWGSAADVVAFGRAMLRGGELDGHRVLGRPFVELMTRHQTAGVVDAGPPPRAATYGLGWGLGALAGTMPGSVRAFGHGGATGTRLWIDPDAGLVIVYLTNDWTVGDAPSLAAIAAVYGALDRG
jgi:CubicO group peptidase (beta-lactamase class C family)